MCGILPWSICLCPLCVACVVPDPPTGHRTVRFWPVVSSLSLPSSCIFAFRLVFLWCPYVGQSAGHIIPLIIPANSNLVVGRRPALRAHVCLFILFFVYFFFIIIMLFFYSFTSSFFISSCFSSLFSSSFFSSVHTILWIYSWYYSVASDAGWYATAC